MAIAPPASLRMPLPPPVSAVRRRHPRPAREPISLLVVALALSALVLLTLTRNGVRQDTWLALVSGRLVWTSGLPHHDTLTLIHASTPWIDQQWLSQVVMYRVYIVGGLALLVLASAALMMSGAIGAVLGARRLGATTRSVLLILPLALPTVISDAEVRTQAYAYPFFVTTLWLLVSDSRRPSRRVLWCLPLLVGWANIHGSASIGAGLIALRGLTLAWERRGQLRRHARRWARPLILSLAPLCLLATPYGLSVVGYYRETLIGSTLRRYASEWQPMITNPPLALFLIALLAVLLWSWWRHPARLTLWERAALLALALGAVVAVRNLVWFDLAALMLAPVAIVAAHPAAPSSSRRRVDRALAVVALAAVTTAAFVTLERPQKTWEAGSPRLAVGAIQRARAADPSLRVWANVAFADWLLWERPQLRGQVAFDARFELLPARWLAQLVALNSARTPGFNAAARGYRLLVLNPAEAATRAFEQEPGRQILYRDTHAVVILRGAAQANL